MYISVIELEAIIEREWLLAAADADRDGVLDADVLAAAITAAEGEIDGYLAARYGVPLNGVLPAVVFEAAGMLALERLAAGHPALPIGPVLQARIKQMRGILEEIGAGRLALPSVSAQRRTDNTVRDFVDNKNRYEAY